MRVIGGKAKGRKLRLVPGDTTRPIRDLVKESLFNILGNWVVGSIWLDLFAGTGSVGIEALSRGARCVLFLDTSHAAVRTIHTNLKMTDLQEGAEVRRENAFAYLSSQSPGDDQYDVIYIAPPQYKRLWQPVLELIDAYPNWLCPDGIAVVQIDPSEHEEILLNNLVKYDSRRYGSTLLLFYERLGE